MSNGDDETADDAPEEESDAAEAPAEEEAPAEDASTDDADEGAIEATLESRLDDAEADLEAADTEAALDKVEAQLDDVESDLEDAEFPEPEETDDDEEDAPDPREELESRLSSLREELEAQRGPYAEDVTAILETAQGTLTDSEWTEAGEPQAHDAVESFLESSADHVDHDADAGDDLESAADALGTVATAIEDAALDPDADGETIAGLLEAAEALQDDLEAAEVWDDLTVQEQLDAKGFYDILTNENRKDFPPEWNAAKLHAKEGNLDIVLYAFDKLGSDFMEEYFLDIFEHLGSDAEPAFEKMHQLAQKRNKGPIKVLGKIGNDEACETLHEFIEGDGDPALQKVTLRALGAIGSAESVQPVANRLAAENDEVRSVAARTLGLLGDTRAIAPLGDVLEGDDSDEVRASAAWALRQIGTEDALDEAAKYTDDRAYLVQAEAEKAAGA